MNRIVKALMLMALSGLIFSCNEKEGDNFNEQLNADSEMIEAFLTNNSIPNQKVIDGIYEASITDGTGTEISPSQIIEISFTLRKFDTGEEFYEDTSYTFIPNKGFFVEGVAGNFIGLNEVVRHMNVGDKSDFYIASGYMFGSLSGEFNDITINSNQIIVAQIEAIAQRTENEQKDHEDQVINSLITEAEFTDPEELANGVYRIITEEGTGDETIASNSGVTVAYKGSLINGETFDESNNATFTNIGNLIEGWKIGLTGLKKDTKIVLFIPSHVAYGENGSFTQTGYVAIPSFETLIFEVEILDF